MASTQMYFYTQVMGSLFKDYEEVEQVTDFWDVSYLRKFCCLPFLRYIVKENCVFTNFSNISVYGGKHARWYLLGIPIQWWYR